MAVHIVDDGRIFKLGGGVLGEKVGGNAVEGRHFVVGKECPAVAGSDGYAHGIVRINAVRNNAAAYFYFFLGNAVAFFAFACYTLIGF